MHLRGLRFECALLTLLDYPLNIGGKLSSGDVYLPSDYIWRLKMYCRCTLLLQVLTLEFSEESIDTFLGFDVFVRLSISATAARLLVLILKIFFYLLLEH